MRELWLRVFGRSFPNVSCVDALRASLPLPSWDSRKIINIENTIQSNKN
jgi:hypothetical protein